MTEAEKYLRSFICDLENECKSMQETLLDYKGRCNQLEIDIHRIRIAISSGKRAIERIEEVESND